MLFFVWIYVLQAETVVVRRRRFVRHALHTPRNRKRSAWNAPRATAYFVCCLWVIFLECFDIQKRTTFPVIRSNLRKCVHTTFYFTFFTLASWTKSWVNFLCSLECYTTVATHQGSRDVVTHQYFKSLHALNFLHQDILRTAIMMSSGSVSFFRVR